MSVKNVLSIDLFSKNGEDIDLDYIHVLFYSIHRISTVGCFFDLITTNHCDVSLGM